VVLDQTGFHASTTNRFRRVCKTESKQNELLLLGLSDLASHKTRSWSKPIWYLLDLLLEQQLGAQQSLAGNLGSMASQRLGAGQQLTGMLRGLSSEQLAAQQSLASGLGSMAGQRLGADLEVVEEFRKKWCWSTTRCTTSISQTGYFNQQLVKGLSAGQNFS
jgi:hypothetical protein